MKQHLEPCRRRLGIALLVQGETAYRYLQLGNLQAGSVDDRRKREVGGGRQKHPRPADDRNGRALFDAAEYQGATAAKCSGKYKVCVKGSPQPKIQTLKPWSRQRLEIPGSFSIYKLVNGSSYVVK